MKKILLLLGAVLCLTTSVGRADTAMQLNLDTTNEQLQTAQTGTLQLSMTSNATLTGQGSDFARGLHRASGASFAQLSGDSHPMPVATMWLFGLIALAVVAGRVFAVHHAKAMADHEHATHHARSQMYRMLHQRD